MAKRVVRELPPGEFYQYKDERAEHNYHLGYDCRDPEREPGLLEASMKRWLSMDPTWNLKDNRRTPTWEQGDHNFPLPPELAPTRSFIKRSVPKTIAHMERVFAPGYDPMYGYKSPFGSYVDLVSTEWKAAIERVEPGVHEFFPFELHFKDGIVSDRFMFRARTFVEVVDTEASDMRSKVNEDGSVWTYLPTYPDFVALKGSVSSRFHWIVNLPQDALTFVSQPLARELCPLLPNKVSLVPVEVTDR